MVKKGASNCLPKWLRITWTAGSPGMISMKFWLWQAGSFINRSFRS
jgi:hypothetical protein